jgi:adenylate cyclase, class 2
MSLKRKPASRPVETEAKIRVPSFVAVKRRMRAAGGRVLNARAMETNTLFDAPSRSLRAAGRSFRVRRYGSAGSVTLKGAPRVEGGLKSREELETHVASPEVLAEILLSLGFVPQFRYEKFREVWKMGATVICLDETPLGHFIEIEGSSTAIHRTAEALGIAASRFLKRPSRPVKGGGAS